MRKKFFLALLLLLMIFACSSKEPLNIDSLIDRNGIKYQQDSQAPYTGATFELYGNGVKKADGFWENGLRYGIWTYYDIDGIKKAEFDYSLPDWAEGHLYDMISKENIKPKSVFLFDGDKKLNLETSKGLKLYLSGVWLVDKVKNPQSGEWVDILKYLTNGNSNDFSFKLFLKFDNNKLITNTSSKDEGIYFEIYGKEEFDITYVFDSMGPPMRCGVWTKLDDGSEVEILKDVQMESYGEIISQFDIGPNANITIKLARVS